MTEYIVFAIVYAVVEYVLGKLKKPKANSVIECVENGVKAAIKARKFDPWE